MPKNIHLQTAAGQSGQNACEIEKYRVNDCGDFITICFRDNSLVLF